MLSAERLERILGCPCGWRGGPVPCEAPTRHGGQPNLFRCAKKEQGKGVKRRELSWHLLCADLLYTFKAARRAARAAATARSPQLPLALPLRRRQRRSAGAKSMEPGGRLTYSKFYLCGSGRPCSRCRDCPGPGRTRQGRLWPQGNRIRRVAWFNVHAKTALTEPARTRSWQLSEAGTRVAGALTLECQTTRPGVVPGTVNKLLTVRRLGLTWVLHLRALECVDT